MIDLPPVSSPVSNKKGDFKNDMTLLYDLILFIRVTNIYLNMGKLELFSVVDCFIILNHALPSLIKNCISPLTSTCHVVCHASD